MSFQVTRLSLQSNTIRQLSVTMWAVPAFAVLMLLVQAPQVRAEDAAVSYMQKVARQLIAANRSQSVRDFMVAINDNAHVQAIGNYALGPHQKRLRSSDRTNYFNGMVRFIARYAASESSKYQVARAEFLGPAYRTKGGVMVDTRVHLTSGQAYDVQWLLQRGRNGYRVRDARVQVVLGDYWMSPFLKDLFEKYISENGSVQALVVALNR